MSKSKYGIRKIEENYVPVNSVGVVSSYDVISDIRPGQNVLVTFMLTKNESGSLQPVANASARCQEFQVMFQTDDLQEVREAPIKIIGDLGEAGMLMIVGYKFGAPKGVDDMYVIPGYLYGRGQRDPGLYCIAGALLLVMGKEGGQTMAT